MPAPKRSPGKNRAKPAKSSLGSSAGGNPSATAIPAGSAKPGFDSLEQQAFLHLWRTYDRLKALEDEVFGQHQITAQQYNLLRLLEDAHPQPLPTLELQDRLISRAPDTTRMIDRLLDRGLVRRQRRDSDRRVVEVALTEAGHKLLRSLAIPVRTMHERQLGHLGGRKLEELILLLKEARLPHEKRP